MKASRLALLASGQLCCALLASGTARALDARTAWSDVWRTPDQQGQALLDAGQPARAAERFHDPRRRAYADLEAGRYQDAAKLLSAFTDTRSEYNRGNALAEVGQLQAALASYDAALKQTPADKDIRHNRDLVARALRQESSQPSSRNGRQGGHGTGSSGQRQQQAGAGQRSGSGSQQSGGPGAQSARGGQTASNGSRNGSNQAGNSGQPGGGGIQSGAGEPQAAGASGSGNSTEAPGQAQRDAAVAAAFARERQQRGAGRNMSQSQGAQRNGASALSPGTQIPKQQPESERQLALDQWLRQIPDSPAGLLQRKFLIEHMMRQQEGEEPQGGSQ